MKRMKKTLSPAALIALIFGAAATVALAGEPDRYLGVVSDEVCFTVHNPGDPVAIPARNDVPTRNSPLK